MWMSDLMVVVDVDVYCVLWFLVDEAFRGAYSLLVPCLFPAYSLLVPCYNHATAMFIPFRNHATAMFIPFHNHHTAMLQQCDHISSRTVDTRPRSSLPHRHVMED